MKPAWVGGGDAPSNLVSLCSSCHAAKTIQDTKDAIKHYQKLNRRVDKAPWEA